MARASTLGNGTILVGLDEVGFVRDFYFPYVGLSNHVSGASGVYLHRIGIYVDGEMSWLSDPEWEVSCKNPVDTGLGIVHAVHPRLQVSVTSNDAVHNEKNVFVRSVVLGNEADTERTIKLFFAQQFRIEESRRGDTGYYDPNTNSIVHYKGKVAFLASAMCNGEYFTEYNIGLFGIEGKEGTYKDAEDGVLECNPIEHGSVDSVIGLEQTIAAQGFATIQYWLVCGHTVEEAQALHAYVLDETPERLVRTTERYWHAWLQKEDITSPLFSKTITDLYQRSLFIMRTHTGNNGAIIASSDTDMLHHGRDTYSYVWPRDGAIIAHAFDVAGYPDTGKKFFTFITQCIEADGYLMHKYSPDGSLGSSWHTWMLNGTPILPIQEDETALVLYMLYEHYGIEKDLEYIESLYNPFIEPAAEFMVRFVEARLGLPQASFDLWEEKFGISTYTASAVYGALGAASQFAQILGKVEAARTYSAVAQKMKLAIIEHLYSDELGMFAKLITPHDEKDDEFDMTIDMSSFHGPLYFGVISPDDERVRTAYETIEKRLNVKEGSGGYVRYEDDMYYKAQHANSANPWVVTTLWVAQYHIQKAKTIAELSPAYELLEWTTTHATAAGMLPEQMHPHTREHLSTAPLVWSHAEFVLTCQAYLRKHAALSDTE